MRIDEADAGRRLDRVLARLLPEVPPSRRYRLIRRGEVRVNGHRAQPEQRLAAGDLLRLPPVRVSEPGAPRAVPSALQRRIEACVIHADERLLVLDKPAGIAVHGGSGVSFGVIEVLRASRPDEELELVHRLDRDTSGVLMVARRRSALRVLHALLREGAVGKQYLLLAQGAWPPGQRRVDAALATDLRVGGERTVRVSRAGKPALTEFRPVQAFGRRATLVEATLHTGRTHQIRVHAAHCGHPVLGDTKYGDAAGNAALAALGLERLFLHAHACSFTWPQTGMSQSFNAPLPPELAGVLERLAMPRRARPAVRRP